MSQTNIINTATGKAGYQVPGAAIPSGWVASNPSATSPAREAYTSSIASNPVVDAYNAGGGKPLSTEDIGKAIGSTSAPQTDYLKSYRDYLSGFVGAGNPTQEQIDTTNERVNIQNLRDTKELESRKAYQDTLHQSGMLKGGAQEAAAELNADNSYILANLGVAESGLVRKEQVLNEKSKAKQDYYKTLLDLSKPMQVGNKYIDPNTGLEIPQTPKEDTGFELSPGQVKYDSKGNVIASLPALPKTAKETAPEKPLPILDISRYNELYPKANVVAGDTETIANQKIQSTYTPEAQTRDFIISAKENGNDYKTIVNEINKDTTIKDKASAIKIVDEVFNPTQNQPQIPTSKIEKEITLLPQNFSNSDKRDLLRRRGYTSSEIANSSVGNIIEQISSYLFGK